ncbi:DUF7507 domain-containing protein [Leifsonia flava]|uniref:DUF7507 domain-containing protein n=1 Tax=Orlajensenia leifsoniae TaxID=2561933 RepID=UPI00142F5B71|nr:DUF11 domain-containing protein [Leifsonia flava]
MVTVPAFADPPTTGTTVVDETFRGATVPDDAWKVLGDACLTGSAAGSTPPAGSAAVPSCAAHQSGPVPTPGVTDGYLQLTDTGFSREGSILYDRPIPASAGISVTFEQYQYGGNGADGIGFFLVDGSTTLNAIGGVGGSLGYAQFVNGQPGIPGGYLGVGLDAWGNYYNDTEGRGTGCPAESRSPSTWNGPAAPSVITVRGPGDGGYGYCWLGATIPQPLGNPYSPGTTLNGGSGTLRADTLDASRRTVNVTVDPSSDPDPRIRVEVQYTPGGAWIPEIDLPAPAGTPSTLKFGLSGSTGYWQDVHLLRNVVVRTVEPLADLVLEKQVDRSGPALPAVLTEGSVIPYLYTVANSGGPVDALRVNDDLVTDVTCSSTSLDGTVATETTTCRGSYTVTSADVAVGSVTNVASASATAAGGTGVESPLRSLTVPLVSSLDLQKSAATPAPYNVGQQVSYSYVVTNTGGSTLTDVSIADDRIAAADLRCPQTVLAPDADVTCTGSSVIAPADLDADGNLVNTAVARGGTAVGQTVQSAPQRLSLPVAVDVALIKTVDDPDPEVGDTITFTVTASNNGPATATGLVVTDTLPGTGPDQRFAFTRSTVTAGSYSSDSGAWSIPSLAPGSAASLTITGVLGSGSTLTNSASVGALDQTDRDPSNDRAVVTVNPFVPTADIAVTKTSDLARVGIGEIDLFTLRASNGGPSAAAGVAVRDLLPPGLTYLADESGGDGTYDPGTGVWRIGDLASGAAAERTIAVRADALGTYTNLATVQPGSTPADSNSANNSSSANLSVVRAETDLSVIKSVSSQTATVGDTVTFQLVASNAGPVAARQVSVADVIPSGLTVTGASTDTGTISADATLWTIGTLPAGDTASRATVTATVTRSGTLVNTATISSPVVSDTVPANNISSASVRTSEPQVDISVAKSASVPSGADVEAVPVGETIEFTLTASNNSAAAATELVLRDALPTGLQYDSDSGDGSYDAETGEWQIATLDAGSSATHIVVAEVTAPGSFHNTLAVVSLAQADTDPSNNTAIVSGSGIVLANLSITKTVADPIVRQGAPMSFTIVVSNSGPDAATDVMVADPGIPDSATVRVSQGSWDAATRHWTVGDLADGASSTLTVDIIATTAGLQQNVAGVIGFGQPDPDLADNLAVAEAYAPSADLMVTKTVDDASPVAGQTVSFVVGISNAGPDASGDVDVQDTLPSGLRFVSAEASVGTFDADSGHWSVGNLEPVSLPITAPQETLTVRAIVEGTGLIENTASADRASAFAVDPDTSNNTASVVLSATPALAELHTTKTVIAGGVAGEAVTYRIGVTNDGVASADQVVMSDTLPEGLEDATTETDGCAITDGTLSCDFGDMQPGSSASATVSATAVSAGTIVNTATVESTSPLSPTSTLSASATLTVVGDPPLVGGDDDGDTEPAGSKSDLARTGTDVNGIPLGTAIALLALGVVLVAVRRRHGSPHGSRGK